MSSSVLHVGDEFKSIFQHIVIVYKFDTVTPDGQMLKKNTCRCHMESSLRDAICTIYESFYFQI